MTNLNQLPTDLPIPQDDGSTDHLKGMKLPNISLSTTNGVTINLGDIKGKLDPSWVTANMTQAWKNHIARNRGLPEDLLILMNEVNSWLQRGLM